MKFNEANTVEAHLRNLLPGAASVRPAQLSTGLARTGGRIAGLGWHSVAPAARDFYGFRLRSEVDRERQFQ